MILVHLRLGVHSIAHINEVYVHQAELVLKLMTFW